MYSEPQMFTEEPQPGNHNENFFNAIKTNNVKDVITLLKDKSIETNVCDPEDPSRPSALLVACLHDQSEIVAILLQDKYKPADINFECLLGRRPIWVAVESDNEELVELLISPRRCELNYTDKNSGCSPLYKAVLGNKTKIVSLLIQGGADVNIRRQGLNSLGETPLIKAVQLNNTEICEILLNAMCNINVKTSDGLTALHFAVAYCRYEICKLLLENKARLHAATKHGATAMTVSIEQNNPVMVQLLIQYGYKMDSKFRYMETPLQQALVLHHEECSMVLVKSGCCVIRKSDKESYFKMAVDEKLFRLMKLLVDVYPRFLKEKWIKREEWPVSIYQTPYFINWLLTHSVTPRKLKSLCRSRIFRSLGYYPKNKVHQLPIPDNLQNFILFPEHGIREESEISIHNKDCPFDCPAFCQQRYCPMLDISDSDDDIEY